LNLNDDDARQVLILMVHW